MDFDPLTNMFIPASLTLIFSHQDTRPHSGPSLPVFALVFIIKTVTLAFLNRTLHFIYGIWLFSGLCVCVKVVRLTSSPSSFVASVLVGQITPLVSSDLPLLSTFNQTHLTFYILE